VSLKSKKIILDTNVIVSALLASINSQSNVKRLFEYTLKNCLIYSSEEIFEELTSVLLSTKFAKYLPAELVEDLLNELKEEFKFVKPSIAVNDCRDKDDNKFLELAIAAKIDFIITGDKDLLELSPYKEINIISPAKAFELTQ